MMSARTWLLISIIIRCVTSTESGTMQTTEKIESLITTARPGLLDEMSSPGSLTIHLNRHTKDPGLFYKNETVDDEHVHNASPGDQAPSTRNTTLNDNNTTIDERHIAASKLAMWQSTWQYDTMIFVENYVNKIV
ncbi:unnamed protein product, partial [Owenia fusiformis]